MTLRTLQSGDTIALVSPASPLDADRLGAITELLEGEGYKLKVFPHALRRAEYLAGSDEERASDLQAAYDDAEVAAVLCTRGGYGCARLFPYLDLDRMAATGKPLIGFSDITTLHLALNRRGLATLHAPMALTLSYPRPEWVYESFKGALKGDFSVPYDIPLPSTLVPGVAEGEVTGGCMCLLTDSIGTPDGLETEGKILILEDVDEAPHRIDAMLTHLRNAGLLQKCAGIVVGEMTRTDDHVDEGIGGRPWREIMRERIADLGIPTIIDYPFGHAPGMLTLPLGLRARLDATAGTLTYT
jgi:muramoyltetrapeptide carboxypeptidase